MIQLLNLTTASLEASLWSDKQISFFESWEAFVSLSSRRRCLVEQGIFSVAFFYHLYIIESIFLSIDRLHKHTVKSLSLILDIFHLSVRL